MGRGMKILRGEGDTRVPDGFAHGAQGGEGGRQGDLGAAPVGQSRQKVREERAGLLFGPVHLPVAGDERAHQALVRASTPGRVMPERYSRVAPPPVETCVNLDVSPNLRTADAESPPPTTVCAPQAAMALAIERVPSANGGPSKSATGRFQRIVPVSASAREKASIVFGPMSSPRQPAGIATPSVTRTSVAPSPAGRMR